MQSSQGRGTEGRKRGHRPFANIDPTGIVIVEGKATDVLADDAASHVQDEGGVLMMKNIAFSFSFRCHLMAYGYLTPPSMITWYIDTNIVCLMQMRWIHSRGRRPPAYTSRNDFLFLHCAFTSR